MNFPGPAHHRYNMVLQVQGTRAYMSAEAMNGDISDKGDVYSFGVVLLEIITSLPVFDINRKIPCLVNMSFFF